MGQVPHIEVGNTPTDITAGLADGCYIGQNVATGSVLGVLFATRATAPTDDADYFRAGPGELFTFTVAAGEPPTWAKSSDPDVPVPVALAELE